MPDPVRDAVALAVVESSQVGEARRLAQSLARDAGLNPIDQAKVGLIVTELATNLARHAVGGELIVRALREGRRPGVECLAIDRGPGMPDLDRCLVDGYSTGGTSGTGLGAVVRLCDRFDAHSDPGVGTVIAALCLAADRPRGEAAGADPDAGGEAAGADLDLGAVCRPLAGESACGDAWAAARSPAGVRTLIVVDGLGHGPQAAAAADAALAAFRASPSLSPAEHLDAIHPALRGTRGAAVAVAAVDPRRGELRYAGVGNIAGTLIDADGARRGLVSHNGTVGLVMPRVQEFAHPWPAGALLVLHSDGLGSSWRLDDRPALRSRRPGVIAGALYRDFGRGRDDVTVVVARDADGGRPG